MNGYGIFSVSVLFFVMGSFASGIYEPTVETPLGKIKGFTMTSRSGNTFFAFKGVPYAQPPIGKLRFQPPALLKPWSGVISALEDGPLCMQISIFDLTRTLRGVEDCLHLSIFTRNLSGHSSVLVHFHGGAYTAGSNSIYGPEYLMDEDIVVVTVNYRLGILGFLSLESPEMPGNQGMKDQVEALRWVQQNIASFGGDPNLVTLIGESAGGGSVYNHILSPMSRGLFHRGVTMSGSTYAPWGLAPPGFPKTRAEKLLTLVNCPLNAKEGIVCLLQKNATEIVSQFVNFIEWQIDPTLNFGPAIEPPGPSAFFTGSRSSLEHNPVPLMMGLNSAEGLVRTLTLLAYNTDFKWFSENFNKLAPGSLLYFATASKPDEVTPAVRKFYFPNMEITLDDWVNVTTMYSDAWFGVSVTEGADLHKGDVYFYYFDYILQGPSLYPFDPKLNFGAFHCSDMALIWNLSMPMVPNIANDYELSLSKEYIKFLVSFMKDGTPVPAKSNIKWPKWTINDHKYLQFTKEGTFLKKGLFEDRYKFWKSLNYRDNYEKGFKLQDN